MSSSGNTKTVLVSISSGIILRNFLAFGGSFLDHIRGKARVVLVVPPEALEYVRSTYAGQDIYVEAAQFDYALSLLQKIYNFFIAHLNFTEGARLFAYHGVRIDVPQSFQSRALYPIKVLISKTLGKLRFFREVLPSLLDAHLFTRRIGKEIFDAYQPSLVFLTNVHHRLDVELIREARRGSVRTIGMPGSWDHFPKRYEPVRTETLLVWNEPTRTEAIELQGYRREQTVLTGAPYYDVLADPSLLIDRESFFTQHGLMPDRKLMFFTSGAVYAPDDADVIEDLVTALREDAYAQAAQLYIRPYPGIQSEHERYDRFENTQHVVIGWIPETKGFADPWIPNKEDVREFVNFLYHADIVINTASSIAIEASAFLKPIVNIGFDGHGHRPYGKSLKRFKRLTHYQHIYETGGTILVEERERLIPTINTFLLDPAYNRENIIRLRDKMCWKIDGQSGKRIADTILSALYEK